MHPPAEAPPFPWTLARRAARLEPSVIREILKLTERPGIVSLAGGLPAADGFPVEALREASARVLREQPREALQYAASEGYGPLRDWVAAQMRQQGLRCDAAQVLVTTGSQQGLDLVAKVLIDAGSMVAVESPTYLGALQAFAPFEPRFAGLACDDDGPLADAIERSDARFAYLLPNFQNPSGRTMSDARRDAVVAAAERGRVPIVEDNPYGELWYDTPPPAPLAARRPDGVVYLGSFSKVLAPGLRLGYVVAPPALFPKLLQAKQAADLHSPSFNQRVVFEAVKDGLLDAHLPALRARYAARRDAMQAALQRHLPRGCRWTRPGGGMFFWVTVPDGLDAAALLPRAVERGVAYVPGAPFFADAPQRRTMRLSFVTVEPDAIERGVAIVGAVLHEALQR
jgi:2-aminoadipate transaminase